MLFRSTKAQVRRCIENWNKGDNGILDLSKAYRLKVGSGWLIDPCILHAPGSLCTYEPQWGSDVFGMYQNLVEGRELYAPIGVAVDTTVAMDFGRISIDSDLVLYLFGTPGQERFDFMWEILSEGMLGFILLIDASRPDTLDQAAVILERFRGLSRSPFVVALNRTESVGWMSPEDVRTSLQLEADVPVVPCDATDRESVKSVLLSLLYSALDLVEDQAAHA